MDLHDPLILCVLGFCLAISFLLSGMETGVFALSRLRIRRQMRAGNARARVLHGFLENPEDFLWTILVGNTLANFAVVSLVAVKLNGWLGARPAGFWGAFVAALFLFYSLCELLPKMLFGQFPNRLCLLLARPFRFLHLALSPLVALMSWVARRLLQSPEGKFTGHLFGSREELRLVMQESAQGLTSEERVMINRVLDLQHLTVREVVTPMDKAVTATAQTTLAELFNLCRQRNISRIPVWQDQDGRRRIAGIVNLQALLYSADLDSARPAGELVKPALYVDESVRLEEALRRLQRSGQRLAIVLGEGRREIGVVSLTDILKVIFGEVSL